MWTIFKVFIGFGAVLLLLYVSVLWPWGMWDLTSLTWEVSLPLHWKAESQLLHSQGSPLNNCCCCLYFCLFFFFLTFSLMSMRRFYNAIRTKSTPLMAMQIYICDDIIQKHKGVCAHTQMKYIKNWWHKTWIRCADCTNISPLGLICLIIMCEFTPGGSKRASTQDSAYPWCHFLSMHVLSHSVLSNFLLPHGL